MNRILRLAVSLAVWHVGSLPIAFAQFQARTPGASVNKASPVTAAKLAIPNGTRFFQATPLSPLGFVYGVTAPARLVDPKIAMPHTAQTPFKRSPSVHPARAGRAGETLSAPGSTRLSLNSSDTVGVLGNPTIRQLGQTLDQVNSRGAVEAAPAGTNAALDALYFNADSSTNGELPLVPASQAQGLLPVSLLKPNTQIQAPVAVKALGAPVRESKPSIIAAITSRVQGPTRWLQSHPVVSAVAATAIIAGTALLGHFISAGSAVTLAFIVPVALLFPFESASWYLREPTWGEQGKLFDSTSSVAAHSRRAADLDFNFKAQGGSFLIDETPGAAYHAAAYVQGNNNRIVDTEDTIKNGSWAFIGSINAREQTWYHPFYGDIPASTEKLAAAYAEMARVFAEATNSNYRSWSSNLDHKHLGGPEFIWGWYERLREAALTTTGIINSSFFIWLRDFIAKEIYGADPSYQFSLFERHTGKYWRPGRPEHEQPIPSNVPRLDQATYQRATQKFYGMNGDGDSRSTSNVLGNIQSWFFSRGWV